MEGTPGQAQDPRSRNPPRLLGIRDLEACLALDRTALNGLWTREQWTRELSDDRRIALGIDDT